MFKNNCKHFPGIASTYPEPVDKKAFIESTMYDYNYDCPLPATYPWPEQVEPPTIAVSEISGDHLKNKA